MARHIRASVTPRGAGSTGDAAAGISREALAAQLGVRRPGRKGAKALADELLQAELEDRR